ncbi:MAG: aspartate-semialdehyde dehydrogenase [Syntrophaceae bacterium CG2_30_49_12]|nr:MAG: aspartate-semialdehyde dehydrogenase [Syntrophaceae bacterium CG2_30_49_12]PIP07609.1 MAG: aspartate-semialdehyde dehydrogenase [Syntrophobacterales bacterium CG23_combo_of_CG06-09_8_20_14_all_48_27]PJA49419.1 MAG: aspartate-semialdehyde dehydrogenase [Syntrophobacterales bacterium CG_4_9_14_3_um_filter_49_8]PJC77099.1 MAG: aspartate-semialdehyde dehydrogenase [Syntrophobacterales bacterium CG_4_8_14_3_um_filter_49_14]
MKRYNVAVVGATGTVGSEMIKILEERDFPVDRLKLLASERSTGKELVFRGESVPVEVLDENSFEGMNVGLFSAGGSISERFAPIAARAGCVVIDNTSAFRMDPEIPLVVPEVNPETIGMYEKRGIIANPNCSTIQMVVALKPIHDAARIRRIVVSTYQAVSGAGKRAIEELDTQTRALLNFQEPKIQVLPHIIAFNCIPQIDIFLDNGYTKEEMKMVNETRKIFHDQSIAVTATAVRVPVFYGHSESVNIETEKKITAEEVRKILSRAPGVTVIDSPEGKEYPLAIHAAGGDDTFVGRIRQDESIANGINMWIVSDNIRKGAALNAVQIAEILIRNHL